jgi:hypothetical protein
MKRIIGISIAVGVSIGAAIGMLFALTNIYVSAGIAMIAILMGSALARGGFGSKCKNPAEVRTANDQRLTTND